MVLHMATALFLIHQRHPISHHHPLAKRQMDSKGQLGQQLWLSDQDQKQRVLAVHLEVQQDTQLIEYRRLQKIP
jgi:hypothetical protein